MAIESEVVSTFIEPETVKYRDELNRIVLQAKITQVGPMGLTGQSTYEAWLSLGNTGTLAEFLIAQAEYVRPRFQKHTILSSNFVLPEVPLLSEALTRANSLDALVGDILVYETPKSVAGETCGDVIYQWEVVDGINGLDVELRNMCIPVYTDTLFKNEVREGFHYKIENENGLFPHEWYVNGTGTPVEKYINPSVDYGVVEQSLIELQATIEGSNADGVTLTSLNDAINAIAGAIGTGGTVDFTNLINGLSGKEDTGVAQQIADALKVDIDALLDAINPEKRVGNLSGYTTANGPINSPAGDENSYFVVLDSIVVDGVTVAANTVLRFSEDSAGGDASKWYVDPIMTTMLQSSNYTNANWDAAVNTPGYIENKPDLSSLAVSSTTYTGWKILGTAFTNAQILDANTTGTLIKTDATDVTLLLPLLRPDGVSNIINGDQVVVAHKPNTETDNKASIAAQSGHTLLGETDTEPMSATNYVEYTFVFENGDWSPTNPSYFSNSELNGSGDVFTTETVTINTTQAASGVITLNKTPTYPLQTILTVISGGTYINPNHFTMNRNIVSIGTNLLRLLVEGDILVFQYK